MKTIRRNLGKGAIRKMPATAPYGSWKSPISAEMTARGSVGLGSIQLDGEDVYWIESRPDEGGRCAIMRRSAGGAARDVIPPPYSARTRVHEYGGLCFWVADGAVFFSNFSDQRVYRLANGDPPAPITPASGARLRYADGMIDAARARLVCVREDHRGDGEPLNAVVALDLENGGAGDVLVSGSDFYAYPAVSPDGTALAWLSWNHPNMPWDETELWTADILADGSLGAPKKLAGARGESIFQPEWSPDGALHFVSDRTGWWNLYRLRGGEAEALAPMSAEFGSPAWTLGARTYAFESAERIACEYVQDGAWRLAMLDTRTTALVPVESPYSEMSRGDIRAAAGRIVLEAASPSLPNALISLDPDGGKVEILRRSSAAAVDERFLSSPQAIEFETAGGETARAFHYPPRSADFSAPEGESPPLIVISHGGPTGAASTAFNPSYQFWTSRGIAVVDVNYGGSAGYGTAYRRRLNGNWGIVDVDDCVNAALHLARAGKADAERLIIRGGSAGGYTTLAALAFRDVFSAGASYYGVSDLSALARDTHKFESRYLDSLIGAYPERRDLYESRSPIRHADRLSCPIILFQGMEDEVVPPSQSETMANALRRNGIPMAYVAFEGEQHGFRKSENIIRALEAELHFYARILGFEPADDIEPVEIKGL